jgi:BirA family transcriptional regulator, biotin operon repressor / biotin---[acetyl-CoA-carboxylase] ligase
VGNTAESIRSRLIDILFKNEQFISGEEISKQLNCSRTAIWKHIKDLRMHGYTIESMPKKGYRILAKPDRISKDEIMYDLHTERLGKEIAYFETLPSTQVIAHKMALEGAPEGCLVIAEEQANGKGRLGRAWHSPKGTGIWMSLILRPNIPPQQAPQLTLLAAVSVVQAITRVTGLNSEIKWPNDVLIKGKKVVGILTELQAESDRVNSVIIGMGINVNTDYFPTEISNTATSLKLQADKEVNRASLVKAILEEMEKLYDAYLKEGFPIIKLLWESYASSLGKMITARTLKGQLYGLAKGIALDGALILEDESGHTHYIYSADIDVPN